MEKRRAARMELELPVIALVDGKEYDGVIRNLSVTGALLEFRQPVKSNENWKGKRAAFVIDSHDYFYRSFLGTVVRSAEDNGHWTFAVELIH